MEATLNQQRHATADAVRAAARASSENDAMRAVLQSVIGHNRTMAARADHAIRTAAATAGEIAALTVALERAQSAGAETETARAAAQMVRSLCALPL